MDLWIPAVPQRHSGHDWQAILVLELFLGHHVALHHTSHPLGELIFLITADDVSLIYYITPSSFCSSTGWSTSPPSMVTMSTPCGRMQWAGSWDCCPCWSSSWWPSRRSGGRPRASASGTASSICCSPPPSGDQRADPASTCTPSGTRAKTTTA